VRLQPLRAGFAVATQTVEGGTNTGG